MMRSVLFVCADDDRRDLYGEGLRQHGTIPVTVPTVDHAEALLRQFQVAALIYHLDPDNDAAWAECDRLRTADTPLIVVVGRVRAGGRQVLGAHELGAAALVTKPCTPGQLAAVVNRVAEGERDFTWPDDSQGTSPSD